MVKIQIRLTVREVIQAILEQHLDNSDFTPKGLKIGEGKALPLNSNVTVELEP